MEQIGFISLIKESWAILKKNFLEVFLAALIFFALSYFIPQLVQLPISLMFGNPDKSNLGAAAGLVFVSLLVGIVFGIVKLFASVGLTKIYLQSVDGEKPDFHYFYKHWKVVLIFFINSLVMGLLSIGVVLGLFLAGLIIAGLPAVIIYGATKSMPLAVIVGILLALIPLAVLWAYATIVSFIQYVSIDKVWGPIEVIERVFKITKGRRIKVSLITLGIALFSISGIILLVVGVVLTILIGGVAFTLLYRKLDKMTPIEGEPKSYA